MLEQVLEHVLNPGEVGGEKRVDRKDAEVAKGRGVRGWVVNGTLLPEDVLRVRRRCALPGRVPIRVLGRDAGDVVGHLVEIRCVKLGR